MSVKKKGYDLDDPNDLKIVQSLLYEEEVSDNNRNESTDTEQDVE